MKISIKATNLNLTPAIKKAIEEKIATLDKFIPHAGADDSVEAFVEVALETRHHRKGKIYYAEANIKVPEKLSGLKQKRRIFTRRLIKLKTNFRNF